MSLFMKFLILASIILLYVIVGCGSSEALVHITYPREFTLEERSVLEGKGSASLNLRPGRQTISFTRNGETFAAVLDIQSGGEIYVSLESKDICHVKAVREVR